MATTKPASKKDAPTPTPAGQSAGQQRAEAIAAAQKAKKAK